MRRSRFVDIARVAQGCICTLVIEMFFDTDGDTEERPGILWQRGGRVVGEEFGDAVSRGVRLKSLLEKGVPDDRRRGPPDAARVDDLSQWESEDAFVGRGQVQSLTQRLLLSPSLLLLGQTVSRGSVHHRIRRRGRLLYQSALCGEESMDDNQRGRFEEHYGTGVRHLRCLNTEEAQTLLPPFLLLYHFGAG